MSKADDFIAAARGFLGTKWKHQGRSEQAMDCVGLVALSARAIGIEAPLTANYGRLQDYMQARRVMEEFCDRVGRGEPGDIVLYKNSQSLHMAIVTAVDESGRPTRVIHSLGPGSRVAESGLQFPALMLWRPKWP